MSLSSTSSRRYWPSGPAGRADPASVEPSAGRVTPLPYPALDPAPGAPGIAPDLDPTLAPSGVRALAPAPTPGETRAAPGASTAPACSRAAVPPAAAEPGRPTRESASNRADCCTGLVSRALIRYSSATFAGTPSSEVSRMI